jgi:hypothetical protein
MENLSIYNAVRKVLAEAQKEIKGGRLSGKTKDLTGLVFGSLTVLHYMGSNKNKKSVWHVKCLCGNSLNVVGGSLTSGNTLSCGCFQKQKAKVSMEKLHAKQWSNLDLVNFKSEDMRERFTTHGARSRKTPDPLYSVWDAMINRCNYVSSYIRKNIQICPEWRESFPAFRQWAVSHGYKKGKHLDRKSNTGNYDSGNCQFLTESEHRKKNGEEMKLYHAERRASNG